MTDGTSYLWNDDRVVEERDEKGVLTAAYEHGQELGPLRLRRPATATLAQQTRYFIGDGQDSTRQLTDGAGAVKDSYFYDSFGGGLGGGQGTTNNAFRYTGQQLDNSGLYYLRARYYDAGSGRFLSHDPVLGSSGDPDSMHRYLYSSVDPVNNVDPSGESDFSLGGMMTAMSMHNSLQSIKADVDTGILEDVADMFGFDASSEGLTAHFINEYTGENLSNGDIKLIIDITQSFGSVRRGGRGGGRGGGGSGGIGGGTGGGFGGGGSYKMMKPRKGKKAMRRYRFQFGKALRNLDDGDGGSQCFVAGTPIVLGNGQRKAIEKIKKGDIVLSRDEKTGKTAAKRVVRTFEKQAPATLVLRFKGGDKVETTEEHPFYVAGRGFTKAGELGIGTSIVTRAGPAAILEKVERKNAPATVYNFEVEDFHTYFVGDGLWVHNLCREQAECKAKQLAGVDEDSLFVRRWQVGSRTQAVEQGHYRSGAVTMGEFKTDDRKGYWGVFQLYWTDNGPRVIVEHYYEGDNETWRPHFHAGEPDTSALPGDDIYDNYDLYEHRYKGIPDPLTGDPHIWYD